MTFIRTLIKKCQVNNEKINLKTQLNFVNQNEFVTAY